MHTYVLSPQLSPGSKQDESERASCKNVLAAGWTQVLTHPFSSESVCKRKTGGKGLSTSYLPEQIELVTLGALLCSQAHVSVSTL